MNDVPDWLWQGAVVNLTTDALGLSALLAWKYRQAILNRLRKPRHIEVTITDELGITDSLRWNVEAPIPPLAKRLAHEGLELVSWYLRQS